MPRSRLSMRKVREILRQRWELGLSVRRIARGAGLSHPTVLNYVRRARACGLSWPLPSDWDDAELERRLFPPPPSPRASRPEPDWPATHRELKRKGVTLQLLWDEYKAAHPEGYHRQPRQALGIRWAVLWRWPGRRRPGWWRAGARSCG